MIKRVLRNGFYVHFKFFDDGYYDNVECYLGPFETSENAYSMMSIIDNDRWVTGRLVRCCTYVVEIKKMKRQMMRRAKKSILEVNIDETCSNEKR